MFHEVLRAFVKNYVAYLLRRLHRYRAFADLLRHGIVCQSIAIGAIIRGRERLEDLEAPWLRREPFAKLGSGENLILRGDPRCVCESDMNWGNAETRTLMLALKPMSLL